MTIRRSPTVRHRRLMAELKRLREASGLSRDEVGERLGAAGTTVFRYEKGTSRPKPSDVAMLLEVYGVTGEEREALIQLAKEARQRGWWHRHRKALKPGFDVYIGLEPEASVIRSYQAQLVPGILQTEGYAREVTRAISMNEGLGDLDRKVEVRMKRQELITGTDPVQLSAILDEAVLGRQVGGPAVMGEQLRKLAELSELPNVTLQVLPFGGGAHPAMDGPFYLLEFPEPLPDVVYLEQATSGLALEDDAEVRHYTMMYGNLAARALDPEASVSLIAGLARDQH